ncbi:citrate synthase [Aureobasidium subglaciale]|nr:citrate synthase [Aureobasidium subglaciale]KAI5228184.1 citrate synthase [Aureobasidium subglaciale]KAI5231396.1 citrate synthase [Aureobasidium subglaciale]KAI5265528.1 citrate synthase [Aureobasidium subglaciale]
MTTSQDQSDRAALEDDMKVSSDPDTAPIVPTSSHEKTDQNLVSTIEQPTDDGDVYSVFTPTQKKFIVLTASLAGFFSPLSGSIYYPALNTIADDLGITATKVNLTVTTYMIVQGLAPMLTAGFSDGAGRRPAYIACFVIYLVANLGLALQNNFAALLVLRCLQSGGSSGTIALANGVVGDIVTSAERGSYVAFASVSSILGPTLSPILGGLLSQYWNWHGIFWFLLAFGGVFFIPLFLFFPETCRNVVGDGSIPAPKLNWNLTDKIRHANREEAGLKVHEAKQEELRKNYRLTFPNPLTTLVVLADLESALILIASGLTLSCFYAVSTGASTAFRSVYGFDDMQVALMFIPFGVGGIVSAFTTGKAVDWNYRRHAKLNGFPFVKNKQQDLTEFPLEKARLEIALPLFYIGALCVLGYGWVMDKHVSLAGPIILLFVMGYALTAAFQILNIVMLDVYPGRPATASAANNIVRCEMGAATSAAIIPMTKAMGNGWAYTLLALLLIAYSPALLLTMKSGVNWRRAKKQKEEQKKKSNTEETSIVESEKS